MKVRPDPVAIRVAARRLLSAADDLEHDASIAGGSAERFEGRWTGSAALIHAGAVDAYAGDLKHAATTLRGVAQEAVDVALLLTRELDELAGLEARRAVHHDHGTDAVASYLDLRIREVCSRIRVHQARFAHRLGSLDPRGASGRRMRTGPVRTPLLGVVVPGRMRTGPVRPVGGGPRSDPGGSGRMRTGPVRPIPPWSAAGWQVVPVRRPVVTP